MTHYLGFKHYGDEYKVMGLASYGSPTFLDAMRVMVRSGDGFTLNTRYFRHQKLKNGFRIENGIPVSDDFFTAAWEPLLGPARHSDEELSQRHMDIAASAQALYEEVLFALLNRLAGQTTTRKLALAGGCAMNSVANGKIADQTPFDDIYIPPAAGDAGGSVGAAAWVYQQRSGKRVSPMTHAYLGYQADASELANTVDQNRRRFEQHGAIVQQVDDEAALSNQVAAAIADGAVVGWYQGRMEWGPRALGARSILCDPRRKDAKDLLNAKIKRRESFRPFAPAILREEVREWFTRDADVPFMMQVLPIREDKRAQIPAVTHVDGSGRLQTVTRPHAPRYYDLIAAFFAKTGVPILLNTSFNENEPIVCTPEQAIDCFLRTKMDMLVLENWIIARESAA